MLFDLKSGKRRRVVQILFGFLAFLFFISFVGFGIGSDVSGGIFDAVGIGGGDSGSGTPQYEQSIEDAEEKLETNPKDERALLDLARYHYLSAIEEGIETDPATGVTEISEDARQELDAAATAWDDYLATKPKRPDASVATNAAQTFVYLNDAEGAARAQRIVAESQDTAPAYFQLAFYLYAGLKFSEADAVARQAVAASDPSNREAVRKNLEQIAEQARKRQKQLEKEPEGATGGGQGIEDPFGALGGGGIGATPTGPTTTP